MLSRTIDSNIFRSGTSNCSGVAFRPVLVQDDTASIKSPEQVRQAIDVDNAAPVLMKYIEVSLDSSGRWL